MASARLIEHLNFTGLQSEWSLISSSILNFRLVFIWFINPILLVIRTFYWGTWLLLFQLYFSSFSFPIISYILMISIIELPPEMFGLIEPCMLNFSLNIRYSPFVLLSLNTTSAQLSYVQVIDLQILLSYFYFKLIFQMNNMQRLDMAVLYMKNINNIHKCIMIFI